MTERRTRYYVDALRIPVEATWGKHPVYGSDSQIADLCSYQMLTSFYEDSFEDAENRRDLLYHYLRGPFTTGEVDSILDLTRQWLPVESFIPKVTNALAIAYNDPPVRTWRTPGASTEHTMNGTLRELYRQMGANGRLQIAHRYARLASGCLVRPYVGSRGRLQIEILTPDLCRIQTHPQFPDRITRLDKPLVRYVNGEPETVFEVWTDEELQYIDYRGDATWFEDDAGNRIEGVQTNPYGRVPYVVMRLVEPNDNSTFSGGLFTLAEANVHRNKVRWLTDASITYESFGHKVAINMRFTGRPILGFGRMTVVDGAGDAETGLAPPNMFEVSSNGQYGSMGEYGTSYAEELQLAAGVPESDVVRQTGSPPSGISRYIARLGLIEQRKNDTLLLAPFEQEFSDVVCLVYNIDIAAKINRPKLPEPGQAELDIAFQDERMLLEPDKAFELYTGQFKDGVITATRYVREVAGRDFSTDADAIAYIATNRKLYEAIQTGVMPDGTPLFKGVEIEGQSIAVAGDGDSTGGGLRESVGGSAQVAALQDMYYSGKLPREAVLGNLVRVFGFPTDEAEELLPVIAPAPPADDDTTGDTTSAPASQPATAVSPSPTGSVAPAEQEIDSNPVIDDDDTDPFA